jgi:Nickel responsive protein SCO4226-like
MGDFSRFVLAAFLAERCVPAPFTVSIEEQPIMPRFMVERTFSDGLHIPITREGEATVRGVVSRNADLGVTWVHSYVADDRSKTFCIYDGPDPESIRKAAQCIDLPVDRISKVTVLDPYFYSWARRHSSQLEERTLKCVHSS